MIEVNENCDKGILAFRVSGELTQEELDNLVPSLEKHASSSDDPHLIVIMEDFKGWRDSSDFLKDLQLDTKYTGYFDRIAIIGDKEWQKWESHITTPAANKELKFFSIDQAEDAWNWAENKNH